MKEILLIGFGGHAKSVIDSIEATGEYHIAGFLETSQKQDISYQDYKVIGLDKDMKKYYDAGIRHAFITIGFMGNALLRQRLYGELKKIGYILPIIIDKSAAISANIRLGEGCYVGKKAVINSNASVGKMCIINSGSIVEHDCIVGDFTHVAVGASLCGESTIADNSFIGANAVILQGVNIGSNSVIGAGSIITKAVGNDCIVHNKIYMECRKLEGK